ncbi:MAG: hypothetical protein OHK0015_31690 [Chloroflexi bacterium OHK40]
MADQAAEPVARNGLPWSPLRRALSWLLTIEHPDITRRTLNQGLQLYTLGFVCFLLFGSAYLLASGEHTTLLTIILACLPVSLVAIRLTHRGGCGGALLLMVSAGIISVAAYAPNTYASPPVIHALFLLPALIGVLFVAPEAGLLGALFELALLALALACAGLPLATIRHFLIIATFKLGGVLGPIVLVTCLFRRLIGQLQWLTVHLDNQVSEQTAPLFRQMTLREQDLTGLVHDIRNHLTVVCAEVDDLVERATAGLAGANVSEAERRVASALGAVSNLVEDLRLAVQLNHDALSFSPEPVDLELLVRGVADQLETLAAQHGCQLTVVAADKLPMINGDERKLERVLANVIGNAIKYSRQVPPERRHIQISLCALSGANGPGVELVIEDQGPGLDSEALAILGQPFVRLASAAGTDGMGLGVYISRGIIERHGGRICFHSPGLDQGTTVTIWLPAAATA